jgi:hypothetical protein
MQVIVRNTQSGLIVGNHNEVATKVGMRTVFVPLVSHSAHYESDGKQVQSLSSADTLVITNMTTGTVRKHELYTSPVAETDKFGRAVTKLSDAAWAVPDKTGARFISTYDSEVVSQFVDL